MLSYKYVHPSDIDTLVYFIVGAGMAFTVFYPYPYPAYPADVMAISLSNTAAVDDVFYTYN